MITKRIREQEALRTLNFLQEVKKKCDENKGFTLSSLMKSNGITKKYLSTILLSGGVVINKGNKKYPIYKWNSKEPDLKMCYEAIRRTNALISRKKKELEAKKQKEINEKNVIFQEVTPKRSFSKLKQSIKKQKAKSEKGTYEVKLFWGLIKLRFKKIS